MFERAHHRRVDSVLASLDAQRIVSNGCLFGGGTAMALRFGEYRETVDIAFLVSHRDGYRQLRALLSGPDGINALTRAGAALNQVREVRADQYGIRTMIRVDGIDIKFEVVLEARIELQAPSANDGLCGVATLTLLDMATSKLLANSDRWRDDAVLSRDVVDLAMMIPSKPLLRAAIAKARGAYGDSIERDLLKAIAGLRERPLRLGHCMQAMGMTTVPKAVLWSRIKRLGAALG